MRAVGCLPAFIYIFALIFNVGAGGKSFGGLFPLARVGRSDHSEPTKKGLITIPRIGRSDYNTGAFEYRPEGFRISSDPRLEWVLAMAERKELPDMNGGLQNPTVFDENFSNLEDKISSRTSLSELQ